MTMLSWVAVYEDGELREFDENGQHGFSEVDHSRLASFALLDEDGNPRMAVSPLPGDSVVFFRRHKVTHSGDLVVQGMETIHCIGIKANDVTTYTFLYADGRVLVSTDLDAA